MGGHYSSRQRLATALRRGLAAIPGVRVLSPGLRATLPVAAFVVDGVPHALVAARLSAEDAMGVRHGCFLLTLPDAAARPRPGGAGKVPGGGGGRQPADMPGRYGPALE